jgi:hypothetical protein
MKAAAAGKGEHRSDDLRACVLKPALCRGEIVGVQDPATTFRHHTSTRTGREAGLTSPQLGSRAMGKIEVDDETAKQLEQQLLLGAHDCARLGQCSNFPRGKSELPQHLFVVFSQARRLPAQTRSLACRAEFDW